MQRHESIVNGARHGHVASHSRRSHFVHFTRHQVGSHRNHTCSAHEHQRQSRIVIAGIDGKLLIAHNLRQATQQINRTGDVAGSVLQTNDIGNLSQSQHG